MTKIAHFWLRFPRQKLTPFLSVSSLSLLSNFSAGTDQCARPSTMITMITGHMGLFSSFVNMTSCVDIQCCVRMRLRLYPPCVASTEAVLVSDFGLSGTNHGRVNREAFVVSDSRLWVSHTRARDDCTPGRIYTCRIIWDMQSSVCAMIYIQHHWFVSVMQTSSRAFSVADILCACFQHLAQYDTGSQLVLIQACMTFGPHASTVDEWRSSYVLWPSQWDQPKR